MRKFIIPILLIIAGTAFGLKIYLQQPPVTKESMLPEKVSHLLPWLSQEAPVTLIIDAQKLQETLRVEPELKKFISDDSLLKDLLERDFSVPIGLLTWQLGKNQDQLVLIQLLGKPDSKDINLPGEEVAPGLLAYSSPASSKEKPELTEKITKPDIAISNVNYLLPNKLGKSAPLAWGYLQMSKTLKPNEVVSNNILENFSAKFTVAKNNVWQYGVWLDIENLETRKSIANTLSGIHSIMVLDSKEPALTNLLRSIKIRDTDKGVQVVGKLTSEQLAAAIKFNNGSQNSVLKQ